MLRLRSTWRLPAPAERVWEVLERVEDWPRWWPGMDAATVVREGGTATVGERVHLVVRSPIGYRLRFGVEIVAAEPPRRATARVVGDLVGTGEWRVEPAAAGCAATIRWHVVPVRPAMRTALRVLAWPLVWAHGRVMQRGETALRALLERGDDHRADVTPTPAR